MRLMLAISPIAAVCVYGMLWLELPIFAMLIAAVYLAGVIWEVPIRRSR